MDSIVKKKATPAQLKANTKYAKANYDQILIRFPKGTKEKIANTGTSINGFVVDAVLKELENYSDTSITDNNKYPK